MNRRGFFKALGLIAAAPLALKLKAPADRALEGSSPTLVPTNIPNGRYAVGWFTYTSNATTTITYYDGDFILMT